MKKITAKVITISSQLLVVSLFLLSLFCGAESNDSEIVISNNNFNKMADKTSSLFRQEAMLMSFPSDGVVELLEDNTKKEEKVTEEEKKTEEVSKEKQEEPKKEEVNVITLEEERVPTSNVFSDKTVINSYVGNLTGYGADCYGCSGLTTSGFDLTKDIYYDDSEYGTIRILAADSEFPMYSIFRVSPPGMDSFIGIVLDRGGNVGFGKGTLFDLAFATESDPNLIPLTRNVTFELLRSGK